MQRYIVTAYFESTDVYTVEADSEEEAIEKCQRSSKEAVPGTMTYVRDVGVECYDWDAEEGGE